MFDLHTYPRCQSKTALTDLPQVNPLVVINKILNSLTTRFNQSHVSDTHWNLFTLKHNSYRP